ncbi:MAG: flagellar basal body P-ring protein FlgI [Pseudohongiellaceae bacterium]|jgi:flagellar basal body P-ring protein FlgI
MATRSRSDKKSNKPKLSSEAKEQLQTITSAAVSVSFTKQQRKEVQQAIEKGMATVRNQTKINNRERDKKFKQLKKQLADAQQINMAHNGLQGQPKKITALSLAPWVLLVASWAGLVLFFIRN